MNITAHNATLPKVFILETNMLRLKNLYSYDEVFNISAKDIKKIVIKPGTRSSVKTLSDIPPLKAQ